MTDSPSHDDSGSQKTDNAVQRIPDNDDEPSKVKLTVDKKTRAESVSADEEFVLTVKASNKEEDAIGAEVRLYLWDYDKAFYDKEKRDEAKHLNEQVTVKGLSDENTVKLINATSDAEKVELKLVTKEKVRYLSFSVPADETREFDVPLVLEDDVYGNKDDSTNIETEEDTDKKATKTDTEESVHVIIDPEVVGQDEEADATDDAIESKWDAPDGNGKKSSTLRSPRKAPADAAPVVSGTVSGDWIWKVVGETGNYTLTFEYTGSSETPPTFAVPSDFVENISDQLGDKQAQITEIIVPEGCTAINSRAFQNLKGLERVEIGSTITTIGTVVFGDNNSSKASVRDIKLKTVTFNTNADGKSALEKIDAGAFTGCTSLSSINIEDTQIRYIGYECFRSTAIESVTIPDSITKGNNNNYYIGGYAFADNSKLKSVDMPALFYIPSSKSYLFSNCAGLEDVNFRIVDGATIKSYDYYRLPDYIFSGDTGLKNIDLSAWEKATNSSTFTIRYYDFNTNNNANRNNLNNLEKITLPKKTIIIDANAFQNKSGINSWDQFENYEYITTIGDRAFYGTRLQSCDMSKMTRLTTIGMEAFKNCESMVDLVIPENVTSIGSAAFKNCDNLSTVKIEAKNLTSVSYSNLFHGDDNLETVTISNKTKSINGNVLASVPNDSDTLFEGENVIQITKATAKGGKKPLKDLSGTYYVDPQGVLYKLSDDGKTSLAYVPPGVYSYKVPEKITTPGDSGKEYTINAMEANALYCADDLTDISFDAPQNVYLKASAFTGWSTSKDNKGKKVQGKDAIDEGQWAEVSKLCDYPIGDSTGELVETLQDSYKNSDGKEVLKVVVAVAGDKTASKDKTYDYLTGQKATYAIAISNDDNTALSDIVRIYFSYSEDGYKMGTFYEGEYNIKNPSTGNIYPMKVVQTDNPNVYYYEITGIKPGETLAFTNDIHYPAKETGGGEVKIWTHTISKEEAEKKEGKVINPGDYLELDWETSPIVFDYNKTNTTYYDTTVTRARSPIIMTDPAGEAYVTALAYRIKETNQSGSAEKTEGLDFIRWVNYSDEISLPDELYWRPEVKEALAAGHWSLEDVSSNYNNGSNTIACKAITVNVNGKKYYVAYLGKIGGYSVDTIDNLKVKVKGDKTLQLSWKVSNTSLSGASATNEYSAQDFYLRFGDGVILADLDKVNDLLDANEGKKLSDLLKVHNETDEVRHYSYSPNQPSESSIDNPVDANYDVLINKKFQKYDDSNARNTYGGTDDFFDITIDNTGILNLNNWGKATTQDGVKSYDGHLIEDTINEYMFIEPQNIEKMLRAVATLGSGSNAGTAPIGDWLTVTISKASLYNNDDGEVNDHPYTDGTEQDNKFTTTNASNISYGNDSGIRVLEAATMVFSKNDDQKITVTLSGDKTEANNRTYVIGSGGDFESIDEFFKAIGFMTTRYTRYKLDYNLGEEDRFTLKPGQKLVVPVLTTLKTTPMLLTNDSESYYPGIYMTIRNDATVRLQVGQEDRNRSVGTKYRHDWYRELFLYKYGYINGSQISGSSSVKDGTVIDNVLSGQNYSNKAYDHISMSDYMTGAQVALVPAAQNPGLTAPDGSPLERYTYNNVIYYLLNKPGEYKGVVFGRKSGANSANERNATQNWKADITVSESVSNGKRTSLNTLFLWEDFENWGGTSAYTYMHYKTLVSAVNSGLAGADNPGEVKQYDLNNKAWLGDHQGHRLWDTMGFYTQVYGFSKYIVTKDGKGDGTDSVNDGTLTKFSRVRESDTVTYQITINNTSTAPTVLNGSRIYDNLPNNKEKFEWAKDINVKNLRFIGSDGVEIKYGSGSSAVSIPTDGTADDHWRIEKTSSSGQQQIRWDSNFNINFPVSGSLKILVDLEFPKRTEGISVWDQYVAELAGKQLENRFYLDSRSDYVNHLLESEGKAVLYKGVYDNGLTTKHPTSSDNSNYKYGQYTSNNTRLMYQNGTGNVSVSDSDLKASTITYYTVLYNGSYDRLYLSDIEDVLPKGFTYNSMCNTANTNTTIWYYSDSNSSYSGYLGYRVRANYVYTENNGNQLVTVDKSNDQYDKNTMSYRNAQVTASTSGIVDGRQHLKFTITGVGYDSEVGKYYLNPGEAVRFGYNVLIDQYAKTDDDATNTVAMPYYDYYGTDFILDVPDEEGNGGAIQKARQVDGITPNDGTCEQMTANEVASEFGMDISKYKDDAYNSNPKGNFMVSSVTVHRAPMTPGLQKTIGGLTEKANNPTATTVEGSNSGYRTAYKGGAKVSDVVNWKLRLYNEAGERNEYAKGMMTDYTVVDTVDSPFGFTGRVYYDMYRATSANGTKVTSSTQYLFTIGTRKIAQNVSDRDTKVRFSSGNTLTASGYRDVKIGNAEDDSDDDWFSFGSGTKSGKVKLERNTEGKEIMTIKMTGPGYSIPSGHWIDLCVHTMYAMDEVIISEPKYNDAVLYPEQDYDATSVVQGRARTKQVTEDDGTIITKNDGIQSGASIMLNQGYTTSSWKETTEIGDKTNTARSDDSKNYIVLSEKTKPFKYDLYVVGPTSSVSKMVVIDDLPHNNDHSAFVEDDKRNSEFEVGFLENDLSLRVALAQKTGESGGVSTYGNETVLDENSYEAYVSTKTEFDRSTDWIGTGDDWVNITKLEGDELKDALSGAKSIRVIVTDPNAWQNDSSKYTMSKEFRLHITFNAKVNDKNAQPGQIAWNSFGYKYQVPLTRKGTEKDSQYIYLEAQPLNVGVKYPCAPKLEKDLIEEVNEIVEIKDPETGETTTETVAKTVPKKADRDMTARFIIYKGDPLEALNHAENMSDEEVAGALDSGGRDYIYVERTVKKGTSASAEKDNGLWSVDYCSRYDSSSGKFIDDTDSLWHWENNMKCSVVELDMSRYNHTIDSWTVNGAERTGNNQAFTNTTEYILAMSASNILQTTDLKITKKIDGYYDGGADSNVSVGFKITAYDKADPDTEIYSNFASLVFNKGDDLTKTATVKDVPMNAVIKITEVYSGNYSVKDGKATLTAEFDEDEGVWTVSFENRHNDEDWHGSGAVNKYKDSKIDEQQGLKSAGGSNQ